VQREYIALAQIPEPSIEINGEQAIGGFTNHFFKDYGSTEAAVPHAGEIVIRPNDCGIGWTRWITVARCKA
jgi:hypothetical protein